MSQKKGGVRTEGREGSNTSFFLDNLYIQLTQLAKLQQEPGHWALSSSSFKVEAVKLDHPVFRDMLVHNAQLLTMKTEFLH